MELDNDLLARFMGYVYVPKAGPEGEWHHENNGGITLLPNELQYDTSWDQLMPVVEKFDELNPPDECDGNLVDERELLSLQEELRALSITSPLSIVYQTLVNAVNWYVEEILSKR